MSPPACSTAWQNRAEGPAPNGTPLASLGAFARRAPGDVPDQAVKSASSRSSFPDATPTAARFRSSSSVAESVDHLRVEVRQAL
jgi:hypothetical protein